MNMKTKTSNKHHSANTKAFMGSALLAVAGLFFALHTLLPEQKLWPAFLICGSLVSMLIAHYKKSKRNEE